MTAEEMPRQIPLRSLSRVRERELRYIPQPKEIEILVTQLDLLGLRKVRLEGCLRPDGAEDWVFDGNVGATAIQPCVVSLEPVTTRIDCPIERRYLADFPQPTAAEIEMPEDDSQEPLPAFLDLLAVIAEALALALPDFPRAPGMKLDDGDTAAAPNSADPVEEERPNPFAVLSELATKSEE